MATVVKRKTGKAPAAKRKRPPGAAARPNTPKRKTPMSEPKKPAADGAADRNVDQIRDILFGGQMRDYERRFTDLHQKLEADLARMREAQDKRLAQIEKRVDDQLEKLNKLVRQEIDDRNGAVADLESRVQQAARTARGEINKAIDGVSGEVTQSDERLRAALADLTDTFNARVDGTESALSRSGAQLHAEKVGREDLAALLSEFALRLTGDFDLPTK